MASSAEQPPKKRKLYEATRSEPGPDQSPSPQNAVVSPPSQEEILKKRRNRDEIRGVYECYKRIKFCLSQKRDSDLEQAYLSLISASRGCSSVQRIVADLIPRYASYCPTSFEAAAKVVINMHNWSLAVINRGEDVDGVAFQTARSCVLGLSDICCTACSEAPTSAVIREICSAVLQNVLTFFVSSFEGKDIFQVFGKEIVKIQDSADNFLELKQKFSDENESPLIILFKLRVLSLFRIFFRYPKSLLAACFDLLNSNTLEGARKGLNFLSQLSRKLDLDEALLMHKHSSGSVESKDSIERRTGGSEVIGAKLLSGAKTLSREAPPNSENCFLALVLGKYPSLRGWIASKFKRISQLSSSKMFLEIKSIMENVVESVAEIVGVDDSQVDNDVHDSNLSESFNHSNLKRSLSYQHEFSNEMSGPNSNVRVRGGSFDDVAERVSRHYSGSHNEVNFHSTSTDQDSGLTVIVDGVGQYGETVHGKSCTPRDPMNLQIPSPGARTPLEFRSCSLDSRNQVFHTDKNMDFRSPTRRSSTGGPSNPFASPRHHLAGTQIVWHSDGDPATMDISSASKQLWVGLLGPDTSEAHVRFECERFGPIEQYFFFPMKGFCVVDYRNIFDAIKARDYLRRHFHWHIKFMDTGLGTRGAMNNIAVGSSCLVYVGSVSNQWEKDEILHESRRVLYKGPSLITDLKNEGALLMELDTPEEAAAVMAHLRQYRKERSNTLSHMDVARSAPTPMHVDIGNNHPGNMFNNNARASHTNMVLESPVDGSWGRMSPLTSLLLSLRAKYDVNHNLSYFENFAPGNFHAAMREDDKAPSNTIAISVPNTNPSFLSDDEVMAICNIAIGNTGSISRLTRTNLQNGCTWFVECCSVDAAVAVLNNLRHHPELFFQIEFSQQRMHRSASLSGRTDSMELISPRGASENHIAAAQGGHPFHSSRTMSGHSETFEAGPGKVDNTDTNMMVDPSHGGIHGVSSAMEQKWVYSKPEMDPPPPPGTQVATHGPPVLPPPIQSSQYMQPAYVPPNTSWDPRAPFVPASMTPLPQAQGTPMQHFGPMYSVPMVPPPPLAPLPPPPPQMPPPLPPSPPPLPQAPPPPSSPPPPPPPPGTESYLPEDSEQCPPYQWQGVLCKSGVHYCSIYALRVDSDVCKYSTAKSEPNEWPAKLDMTKRTDFRHVQSTFNNTPPHKREVCMIIPSSPNDHKGFQDFISYLKQRECAGVIKIPPSRSIWSRLLFILPYSHDLCSMLSIAPPNMSDCLVALLLPKETNFEWV